MQSPELSPGGAQGDSMRPTACTWPTPGGRKAKVAPGGSHRVHTADTRRGRNRDASGSQAGTRKHESSRGQCPGGAQNTTRAIAPKRGAAKRPTPGTPLGSLIARAPSSEGTGQNIMMIGNNDISIEYTDPRRGSSGFKMRTPSGDHQDLVFSMRIPGGDPQRRERQ